MSRWRERILRAVLGLWAGGLIAIDLVETPARFRAAGVERRQIVTIGRGVFRAFNRYQLLLTTIGLPAASRGPGWRTAAVGGMGLATLAQAVVLQPWMDHLSARPDFDRPEAVNPHLHLVVREAFRSVHRVYVGLDAAKIALALLVLLNDQVEEGR